MVAGPQVPFWVSFHLVTFKRSSGEEALWPLPLVHDSPCTYGDATATLVPENAGVWVPRQPKVWPQTYA